MSKLQSPKFVGWSLIFSVAAWIVQLIAVSLLYATWVEFFGSLSDFTNALSVLLMLPLVLALHSLNRGRYGLFSLLAVLVGTAGILVVAGASLILIAGVIDFGQSLQSIIVGFSLIGVWLLASLGMARRGGALPRKVTGRGMLVGLGLAGIGLLIGSLNAGMLEGGDFSALWSNPLVYPALVLVPIGYFGYPLWAFWFGRKLLRGDVQLESGLAGLESTAAKPASPAQAGD